MADDDGGGSGQQIPIADSQMHHHKRIETSAQRSPRMRRMGRQSHRWQQRTLSPNHPTASAHSLPSRWWYVGCTPSWTCIRTGPAELVADGGNDDNKTDDYCMVKDGVHVCTGAALSQSSFDKKPARRRSGSVILRSGPPSSRPRCLSGEMRRSYRVHIRPSEGGREAGVGGSDLVGRASLAEPGR